MERVQKIMHKGNAVVVTDLTDCPPAETLQVLPLARKKIEEFAPKSGLSLLIVTGAKYDKDVAEAIKNFSSHNTPYLKASAVVGIQGVQSILLQTVVFITRREIKTFDTRPEALDWLASK